MARFQQPDLPTEVVQKVREQAEEGWEQVFAATGTLAIAKLRLAGVYDDRPDGYFMLRIRLHGGRLTPDQAQCIGEIARDLCRKPDPDLEGPDAFLELTTRQDIQLHWLTFEALPVVWDRFEKVGLTSLEACGDSARNITSCPVTDVDPDQVLDVAPVVEAVNTHVLTNPRTSAFLPRKFKTVITGCATDCVVARINDIAFTPARKDGVLGFHVWVGGGLSDSPRPASLLNIFITPDQAVAVTDACLRVYRELGDPVHKAVNRFRVLVHELGDARIEEELIKRLPFTPQSAGEDLSTWQAHDHLGIHDQKDGERVYVGLNVPVGRMLGTELIEAARLAREYGNGGVRVSQRQNLIVTGIDKTRLEAFLQEPLLQRLSPHPDPFERSVVACTSAPFCKFGILNTKQKGTELIAFLRETVSPRAAEKLDGMRLQVSGCKASCAQVHVGHFGLRSSMARQEDGYVDAFDVALGGDIGKGKLARWSVIEVPAPQVFAGITALVEAYAEEADDGETLDDYIAGLSDERRAAFFQRSPLRQPAAVS